MKQLAPVDRMTYHIRNRRGHMYVLLSPEIVSVDKPETASTWQRMLDEPKHRYYLLLHRAVHS